MISIHMTTAARYENGMLERAIASVLSQSYREFEFIICDDGSRDGTASYLEALEKKDSRVSIIRNPENIHSVAVSLGCCMNASSEKFPYICWMFDDNVMMPDALEKLITTIESESGIDFVYGKTICHLKDGGRLVVGGDTEQYVRENIEQSSVLVPNAGLLVKRKLFDVVGWYDSSVLLRRSTDWDLFCRMFRVGRCAIIPDVLMEEYGDLEADSLRNSYTTSLELMKKYVRFRDAAGWDLSLNAALYHPADRIPVAQGEESWSQEERKQLFFIMLEYYVSIRNWIKAGEWAEALLSEVEVSRHWIKSLFDDVGEGNVKRRLENLAALSGIMYGLHNEMEKRNELERALSNTQGSLLEQEVMYERRHKEKEKVIKELEGCLLSKDREIEALKNELMSRDTGIHKLHLVIEKQEVELHSLRYRMVDKLNSLIKSLPFLHRFSKHLLSILLSPFKQLSRV